MSRASNLAAQQQIPMRFAGYDSDILPIGAEPGDFCTPPPLPPPLAAPSPPRAKEESMLHQPDPRHQQSAAEAPGAAVSVEAVIGQPYVIAFDFETIPRPDLYRATIASGPDKAAALEAAAAADKAALQRILGPGAKMGRLSKADALTSYAETYCEEYAERCARMGMSPMELAIVTAAIYTETPTGGPQGYILSWGSGESAGEYTDPVTGAAMTLQRWGLRTDTSEPLSVDCMTDEEWYAHERVLLLGFWHVIGQFGADLTTGRAILASHNGARFDVPALRWRTVQHQRPITLEDGTDLPPVRPTVRWSLVEPQRYRTRPHLDTLALASGWETSQMAGKGLEAVSAAVGLPIAKHDGMDGAEVFPAAVAGDQWGRIEAYCMGDACTVHGIAQAFLTAGVI